MFVAMAKEGSTVGGMMDVFATGISLCLQYGVPLEALVKKFTHQRFEPSGMTSNRNIPFAKSVVDYIFRWLEQRFLEDRNDPQTKPPEAGSSSSGKDQTVQKSAKAAPEAVMDDVSSEPGRAQQASRLDAKRPVGALLEEKSASGASDGGNGNGGKETAGAEATMIQTATLLVPARSERIDRQFSHFQEDAPPCPTCGSITVRNGNCYKCHNCGSSLGCS